MRRGGADVEHECEEDQETEDGAEDYDVKVGIQLALDLPMSAHSCLHGSALGWQSREGSLLGRD